MEIAAKNMDNIVLIFFDCSNSINDESHWLMTLRCEFRCKNYAGPTKPVSHFLGLSTPTSAEFSLLKILELSCKLLGTTKKQQRGVDSLHLPLTNIFSFFFEEMYDSDFETVRTSTSSNWVTQVYLGLSPAAPFSEEM